MQQPDFSILSTTEGIDLWAKYLTQLGDKTRGFFEATDTNRNQEIDDINNQLKYLYKTIVQLHGKDRFLLVADRMEELEEDNILAFLHSDVNKMTNEEKYLIAAWRRVITNLCQIMSRNQDETVLSHQESNKKVKKMIFVSPVNRSIIASAKFIIMGDLVKLGQEFKFTWHPSITAEIRNTIFFLKDKSAELIITQAEWTGLLMRMAAFFNLDMINIMPEGDKVTPILLYKSLVYL